MILNHSLRGHAHNETESTIPLYQTACLYGFHCVCKLQQVLQDTVAGFGFGQASVQCQSTNLETYKPCVSSFHELICYKFLK